MPEHDGHRYYCTKETCPISASIYGYYPSLGWNAFPLAIAAIACVAQLGMGIKFKTWSYMVAVTIGCFLEAIGYGGRIALRNDPFNGGAFKLQIVGLTLAPAFLAAGLYLNLKHLIIVFGSNISLLKPHLYTWIFVGCDIFSIAMQGVGGGMAASDFDPIAVANDIMIAGLAFQTVTLFVFGILSVEYALRAYRNRHHLNPTTADLRHSLKFKLFLGAIVTSFITILTRCAYRIAEMSGGWRNPIMQNETEFVILDTIMIVVAEIAMTVFHPGWCFRQGRIRDEKHGQQSSSDENSFQEQNVETK